MKALPPAAQDRAIKRVSALILINAMVFQEVLAKKDPRVRPLQFFHGSSDVIVKLSDHWKFILDKINYHPIFHIAHELLSSLTSDADVVKALDHMLATARQIVNCKAALRHDLAGRIFHRLLAEAKYLGAYYTSIPAAALLLKLALRPNALAYDCSSLKAIGQLKIADLACGTGTLLMAAADTVADNYIRGCAEGGTVPKLDNLHHVLLEKVLCGYDVLPSAIHLTASTLALRIPDIPVPVTNLNSLPLGGYHNHLGSLEFFKSEAITGTLFAAIERASGKRSDAPKEASLPELDLCVMNPPFTSSRQPNLLFGSVPTDERPKMQKALKDLVATHHIHASITAGLGALFVALGDRYLKANGRLAVVLPRSILSGVAWEKTRALIADHYHLEYVIVSHEPDRWNFSENTQLSEVLLVAHKTSKVADDADVIYVNLWHNPRNAVEALSLARAILAGSLPELRDQGSKQLIIGEKKFGEAFTVSWKELKPKLWSFPCAFAQSELTRALAYVQDSRLYIPGKGISGKLPFCPLDNLCNLGPDPRDVYDGFDLSKSVTAYPALWGHDADKILTMRQSPNAYLEPLAEADPGRPLRKLTDLWPKAGSLLIAQRPWLNTKRVMAVHVTKKVLADVWCPLTFKRDGPTTVDAEKALALWLNSTLSFLLFLGYREETRGAWVQFKKPVLAKMPVLDVWKIESEQRKTLAKAFDDLGSKTLTPFPQMDKDPTRQAIDSTIAKVLGFSDPSMLREMLSREPIVCLSLARLLV